MLTASFFSLWKELDPSKNPYFSIAVICVWALRYIGINYPTAELTPLPFVSMPGIQIFVILILLCSILLAPHVPDAFKIPEDKLHEHYEAFVCEVRLSRAIGIGVGTVCLVYGSGNAPLKSPIILCSLTHIVLHYAYALVRINWAHRNIRNYNYAQVSLVGSVSLLGAVLLIHPIQVSQKPAESILLNSIAESDYLKLKALPPPDSEIPKTPKNKSEIEKDNEIKSVISSYLKTKAEDLDEDNNLKATPVRADVAKNSTIALLILWSIATVIWLILIGEVELVQKRQQPVLNQPNPEQSIPKR